MNGRTTLYLVENCGYDYGRVRFVKSINQVTVFMTSSLNGLMAPEYTTAFSTRTMFTDLRIYD